MAQKSSFFNAVMNNGIADRAYNAEDYASYFGSFITNGVFPNPATNLQIIANNNMTITLKAGKAWINGYYYYNDSDLVLNIDVADGVLKRIDRVVIRLDHVNREIKAYVKKGTFASSPTAPSLTRDVNMHELGVAEILVNNGAVSINQANITDTRLNNSVCGIVSSLIEFDTDEVYSQMKGLMEQREAEFNEWFNDLQTNLDGNVATNLQNQINVLEDDTQTSSTSEDLLNENVTSFKVGTGKVNGVSKDYTNQMEQSLVSIDSVVGKTVKESNMLTSVKISNIGIRNSIEDAPFSRVASGYVQGTVETWGVPYKDSKTGTPSTQRISCVDPIRVPMGAKYFYYRNTNVDFDCALQGCKGGNLDPKNDIVFYDFGFMQDNFKGKVIEIPDGVTSIAYTMKRISNVNLTPSGDAQYNRSWITFLNDNLSIIGGDLELRSLPNGVADKLDNGVITRNTCEFLSYNFISATMETNPWNSVYGFKVKLPVNVEISTTLNTQAICNKLPLTHSYQNDTESFFVVDNSNIIIKILKTTIDSVTGSSTLDKFYNYMKLSGLQFILQLATPTKEVVNTSILAKSGDTIFIDTPVPITCTHKVQLNTKAQVEEMQEIVVREKKSVWQKFKELTDINMNLGRTGYIKFPKYLGNIVVQWGTVVHNYNNQSYTNAYHNYWLSLSDTWITMAGIGKGVVNPNSISGGKITCCASDDNNTRIRIESYYTPGTNITASFEIGFIVFGRII